MKRIEYTAAAIRLLGVYWAVILLAQTVDISSSIPTRVYSAAPQPVLHLFGVAVMTAQSGEIVLFWLKLALAAGMIIYALRWAKLFWVGILPEVADQFQSVLRRKTPGEIPGESHGDLWSDSL